MAGAGRIAVVSADFQRCDLAEHSRDSIPMVDLTSRHSTDGAETKSNLTSSTGGSTGWSGGAEVCSILGRDTVAPHKEPTASAKTIRRTLAHQSSGSDRESFRQPSKARCLRKTKSRGKGKGCSLSPGLKEFGFDNDAYSSDSSSGGGKDSHKNPAARECWK